MCETTVAILIVLIIVVSVLIVRDTKDNFSSPPNMGLTVIYKIFGKWDSYPLWTVEKGSVFICSLYVYPNPAQFKVLVIDRNIQDFDLLDYIRKSGRSDFDIDNANSGILKVNLVYTPSKQNPDLANRPIFYFQENYSGTPIPGNAFQNDYDVDIYEIPPFIKSCRLNGRSIIMIIKSPVSSVITLMADSPKL